MLDIPVDTKRAAGREVGPAGLIVFVSKSNLSKLERALKKFKASNGVKIWSDKCTSNASFSGYSLNDYKKRENKTS